VEGRRQLGIHHVRLGTRALNQDHKHFVVAEHSCHMKHSLALRIVHVLGFHIVEFEEFVSCSLVIVLNGLPERVVHALLVAEEGGIFVADFLIASALLGAEISLDFEVFLVFDGRILYDLVIV